MDERRRQRTEEAATPFTDFWEMRAKLTSKVTRPDPDGEEVIQSVGNPRVQPVAGEPISSSARDRQRALTACLMEQACEPENLNRAYARVKANKGAPGVDGMSVSQLGDWIKLHEQELISSLLEGSYRPQPVRGVQIPKPGGKGMRQLGIPTVVDRLVQQAIKQVLEPILDPSFSASSYGFRPGRGAHDALAKAKEYVAEGRVIVVDIDLEKFFDKVPHDRLMCRLEERIADKRILRLIRHMLKAKVVLPDGVVVSSEEGTPQGGPLSPLLSNIVLDELDQELTRRGHYFVRYADDCNVYTRSKRAAERVMRSTTSFIERRLGLKVNTSKSAVARAGRHFLGFRLLLQGGEVRIGLSARTQVRLKTNIREHTPRTWGQSLDACITKLNAYLRGWVEFFGIGNSIKGVLRNTDAHLRRRLRAIILHQWKTDRVAVRRLIQLGVHEALAGTVYLGQVARWHKSQHEAVRRGLHNAFFAKRGLLSLESLWLERHAKIAVAGNPA